jgi:hypothetical protein
VAPATGTAAAGDGQGSVTVTPATCLISGEKVTVTATGLSPFNTTTNPIGTILECNTNASQPTESLLGKAIPDSCTGALANSFTPTASGSLAATTFSIVEGTTGPPVANTTDSAGNPGATDAAKYPCGPAADTCVLAVGDLAGDEITVPISFNTNVPIVQTTTTTPGAATKSAAKTSATKAGSGSLAFTGTGPGLWWLGLIGVILMAFGGFVLVVIEGPRRRMRLAQARVQSQ